MRDHFPHSYPMLVMLIPYLLTTFPGCGGCMKSTEEPSPHGGIAATSTASRTMPATSFPAVTEPLDGNSAAPRDSQGTGPVEVRWSLLPGEEDTANRYSFTVMVIAHDSTDLPQHRECSGTLVSPHVVLTAGQCVCQRQKAASLQDGMDSLIDASRCASKATVVTVIREPPTLEGVVKSRSENLIGTVRPHPKFRLLVDDRNEVVSSAADLAIILLEQPAEEIPPVPLAAEPARVGETLTVVGYGYIESVGAMNGRRRFRKEQTTEVLDPAGERVKFKHSEIHAYKGDTGGPCLREAEGGPTLVGISSFGMGHEPACTSTSLHQEWLRKEIELANLTGAHQVPGAVPQRPPP
jgi:hypothetical protein